MFLHLHRKRGGDTLKKPQTSRTARRRAARHRDSCLASGTRWPRATL